MPVDLLELNKNRCGSSADEAKTRAVRIHIEAGSLPVVHGGSPQIRQVLVNLLSNAIDAAADMPAEPFAYGVVMTVEL